VPLAINALGTLRNPTTPNSTTPNPTTTLVVLGATGDQLEEENVSTLKILLFAETLASGTSLVPPPEQHRLALM